MREILFRGKSGDGWHYGLLTKYGNHKWRVIEEDNNMVTVKTNTIGQYTGLTDKNGTKIFEGDIIRFCGVNHLVFWNGEQFQWQARICKDGFYHPVFHGQDTGCSVDCVTLGWVAAEISILGEVSTEIVGNIYDNPELLNVKE